MGDRLGEGLDEPEAGRLDDRAARLEDDRRSRPSAARSSSTPAGWRSSTSSTSTWNGWASRCSRSSTPWRPWKTMSWRTIRSLIAAASAAGVGQPRTIASVIRATRTFGPDVVDPDDVRAGGDPERGRRQGRLEPLVGRQVEDPAEGRLARRAEQDRPAEDAQRAELAQERQVVVGRLAEAEARIDDQRLPPAAGAERPLDRPPQVGDRPRPRGPRSAAPRGCASGRSGRRARPRAGAGRRPRRRPRRR